MRLAREEGNLKGEKVSRRGPVISHLLFLGNCILFCVAPKRGGNVLKNILKQYDEALGQCVNYDKSVTLYNKNTKPREQELVT